MRLAKRGTGPPAAQCHCDDDEVRMARADKKSARPLRTLGWSSPPARREQASIHTTKRPDVDSVLPDSSES